MNWRIWEKTELEESNEYVISLPVIKNNHSISYTEGISTIFLLYEKYQVLYLKQKISKRKTFNIKDVIGIEELTKRDLLDLQIFG
jgi:hypothetical protein